MADGNDEVSRTMALGRVTRKTSGMTAAKKAESKAKRELTKPWVELRAAWYEAAAAQAGTNILTMKGVPTWGPQEIKLSKLLLRDVDLATASAAVRYFIVEWCPRHNKAPGFNLFWAMRAQILAEASGAIKPTRTREERKDERLSRTEHNPEAAAKSPKIGWG